MMIKGSLLCSIPIVKGFRRKFSKSENGPEIGGFVGFSDGKNFNPNTQSPSPRKSIPTETRYLVQKRWSC